MTTGDLLKTNLGSGVTVRFDQQLLVSVKITDPFLVDQVYASSSRGPNPSAAMKIPLIVTDGCGSWETLIGLGTGT